MITIRYRYVPSAKALAVEESWRPEPRDEQHQRASEKAYWWICHALNYGSSVRQVKEDTTGSVSILCELHQRNTGSLIAETFSGPLAEMIPCLVAVYYWYDGECVEPPPDYPFSKPEVRQSVLDAIKDRLPLRDAVGELLRKGGYEPVQLEGLYDVRGCASVHVGIMVYAGITDPARLKECAGMDSGRLFEACEYVRILGLPFEEALAEVPEKR